MDEITKNYLKMGGALVNGAIPTSYMNDKGETVNQTGQEALARLTQKQAKPSIVSSATPIIQNNYNTAADSGLTNATSSPDTNIETAIKPYIARGINLNKDSVKNFIDSGMSLSDAIKAETQLYGYSEQRKIVEDQKASQEKKYQLQLEQDNAEYASALNDIRNRRDKDLNLAKATAAQLNPYSGANTDEMNYGQSIKDRYDQLEIKLATEAKKAQAAAAAGNEAAVAAINANMIKIKENEMSSITSLIGDMQKRADDQKKTVLNQKNFESTQKEKYLDDYRISLTSMPLPDPSKLSKMTDEEILATSWGKIGLEGGLTPEQMRNDALQGSFKQKSLDQQQIRTLIAQENSARDQQRLALQLEKANRATAVYDRVKSAREQAIAAGQTYGSPEYVAAGALATYDSPYRVTQQDVGEYSSLEALSTKLPEIRNNISKLSSDTLSPLVNAFNSYIKNPYAENLNLVNSAMQGLASVVGKGVLSQVGNMSDTDVKNVLASMGSTASTAKVREILFDSLMKQVSDKALIKLNNDASSGKNVANFVPSIQAITKSFDKSLTKAKTDAIQNATEGTPTGGYKPTFDINSYIKELQSAKK